jgi:hypothetical protein
VLWPRRRKGSALNAGMRDALFADASLEEVASRATSTSDAVWSHFAAAQQALTEGDKIGAIQAIRRVEEMEGLEARLHLQAWHCLRTLGEPPPESIAREVKGVVVEYGLRGGVDLVAAYADQTARYWNFRTGTGILWDVPGDPEMASLIDALLQAGEAIVENTGPWDGARPPVPWRGRARINVLTLGGLHFGEDEFDELAKHPLGGPAINAALGLMLALMEENKASREHDKNAGQ